MEETILSKNGVECHSIPQRNLRLLNRVSPWRAKCRETRAPSHYFLPCDFCLPHGGHELLTVEEKNVALRPARKVSDHQLTTRVGTSDACRSIV